MTKQSSVEVKNKFGETTATIYGGKVAVIPYRQKIAKGECWFMGFQEMFETLALDKELTGQDRQVLLYLFSQCDFENWIKLSQSYIAKKIGIHQPNVAKSIRKLVNKNYIRIDKTEGVNAYQINPELIWKGTVEQRNKIIPMFPGNHTA